MTTFFRRVGRAIKWRSDVIYLRWWLGRRGRQGEFYRRTEFARHGVIGRVNSTDAMVYRQIFVNREYGCVDHLQDVKTIVDLGANVGYASAYMLAQFPHARVVAVEPDPESYALLKRNLAPYQARCALVEAAAWSRVTRLDFRAEPYRGGGSWARQVEQGSGGSVVAIDLATLFAKYSLDRVSILKMDIEGAEVEVFSGDMAWLDRVDVLVIELHDDSVFGPASSKIIPQLEAAGFTHRRNGELTIFERRSKVG